MKTLPSTICVLDREGFENAIGDSYCHEKVAVNYADLRNALKDVPGFSEGFFINRSTEDKEDPDYPSDTYKTDVTFALRDDSTGDTIVMWNYKNGPAYGEAKTLGEIDLFSVYFGSDIHEAGGRRLLELLKEACH